MKQTSYTSIPGLRKSLRTLPKAAAVELRDASVEIAADIAADAKGAAGALGGVAALAGGSLRASRDRIPVVALGGSTPLPDRSDGVTRRGKRQTIGDIIWGAEFGGGKDIDTMQFRPHRGKLGYFLWPTVRARSKQTQQLYSAALNTAMQRMP